jgi:outer membrane lipoprotein-sorting protein
VPEDARRVIALLAERWQSFSDLRTLADIRVQRGDERLQLTGVLLARAPASVRFEALSPLGAPLLLVTIDDGTLTSYNVATNEALVGPATAETAARLLSLPFDPDDLVGVLAGRPVPPKDVRTAQLLPPDENGPSIEINGAVNRLRVWLDLATGVARQAEITGGRYEVRVTYEREAGGPPLGFALTAGQGQLTGSVTYRAPTFDAGVAPERFHLTLPETAKIGPLR